MREILFRGKAANRKDNCSYRTTYKNGDWVYGFLTNAENYAGFAEMTNTDGVQGIEVDKNTIGQFTGLTDKNGKKIFEGDIVRAQDNLITSPFCDGIIGKIVYDECAFFIEPENPIDSQWLYNECAEYEIIGNIHDNPELLKGCAE